MPKLSKSVRKGWLGSPFDNIDMVKMNNIEDEVDMMVRRKTPLLEIVEYFGTMHDLNDEEWTLFCLGLGYMEGSGGFTKERQ